MHSLEDNNNFLVEVCILHFTIFPVLTRYFPSKHFTMFGSFATKFLYRYNMLQNLDHLLIVEVVVDKEGCNQWSNFLLHRESCCKCGKGSTIKICYCINIWILLKYVHGLLILNVLHASIIIIFFLSFFVFYWFF